MAEIQEVFEDFSEGVKKTVKKKPFLIAAAGVGAVGLFVAWKKSRANVDTTAYEAVGYGGYPQVSGEGGGYGAGSDESDTALFEQILAENDSYYQGLLGDMEMTYQKDIAGLTDSITALTNRADNAEEQVSTYQTQLERATVISQMRANSELYNVISDTNQKEALHAENMALAEKMGWEFNPETGNYYEGNSIVYVTAKQQAGYVNPSTVNRLGAGQATNKYTNNAEYNKQVTDSVLKSTAATGKGYDINVDYSLAIVKAKESGASAETINALETARQNKINDVYGGVDPATKKTTTSTAGTSSTVSTSSKSAATSSVKKSTQTATTVGSASSNKTVPTVGKVSSTSSTVKKVVSDGVSVIRNIGGGSF